MTNKALVRIRVWVRAWFKIYMRTRNYYPQLWYRRPQLYCPRYTPVRYRCKLLLALILYCVLVYMPTDIIGHNEKDVDFTRMHRGRKSLQKQIIVSMTSIRDGVIFFVMY